MKRNTEYCQKIVDFLEECLVKDYDIDTDNIKHIMNLNFDYIRKQHIIVATYPNGDAAIKALEKELDVK